MLSRIKFDIASLVNEMLDQLPAEVWTSTTTTFLDPAIGGGQFVREIERRLRAAGHSDKSISERVYGCETFPHRVKYAINTFGLVGTYSVGDFLEGDFGNMKFDVVVGNPPFSNRKDSTNKSADLDSVFLQKTMAMAKIFAMIIRTKHFNNPKSKFRKETFSSGRISAITYIPDEHFPTITNTATCVIYGDDGHHSDATITYKSGVSIEKSISADTIVMFDDPDYTGPISNSMAHRWQRGKLNRNKIVEVQNGIDLIEVIDRRRGLIIKRVAADIETTGYRQHGVVLNVHVDWGGLGRIEIKPYNAAVSSSVVFLKTSSKDESLALIEYLNSESVVATVKKNMASFNATKALFDNIPDIEANVK